ncbi:MAG: 39S ribosomal protein L45 [Deltaproteobacteria bacterium]|nr:39S ribosomal protein L45 [Deltaproteobacteria bacterium]
MKKFLLLLFFPLLLAGSFVAVNEFLPDSAEAARFGGGRSFGGGSFNRSAPAPLRQPGIPSRNPSGNTAQNPSAGFAPGGMGGMMGGLLAGSMLGALLFGGAFSGIGGMDLLLLGAAVFLVLRLLRSRRQSAATATAQSNYSGRSAYDSPADPWGKLRQDGGRKASAAFTGSEHEEAFTLPAGFDLEDFMKGAKIMFTRMQESWDKRDLEDIALFTGKTVLREIERQAAEDPEPSTTDILMINARLLDFKQNETNDGGAGTRDRAAVYFEVLLREEQNQETHEVREIWHFIRRTDGAEPGRWKLGGLQQVED